VINEKWTVTTFNYESRMWNLIIILLQEKVWLLASEKVNSVLVIVLLIFGAVLTYLILTQRKVVRLEKQMEELERE
jgi:uncharacterized membrane protein